MKTIELKAYGFDELNEKAKEAAINNRIEEMLTFEVSDHYENWAAFKKAIDKAESMQTPWFTGSYVYDYCKNEIIADLQSRGEEFDEFGRYIQY